MYKTSTHVAALHEVLRLSKPHPSQFGCSSSQLGAYHHVQALQACTHDELHAHGTSAHLFMKVTQMFWSSQPSKSKARPYHRSAAMKEGILVP